MLFFLSYYFNFYLSDFRSVPMPLVALLVTTLQQFNGHREPACSFLASFCGKTSPASSYRCSLYLCMHQTPFCPFIRIPWELTREPTLKTPSPLFAPSFPNMLIFSLGILTSSHGVPTWTTTNAHKKKKGTGPQKSPL